MCTAVTFSSRDFYMGRTFDYERGFGEAVVCMPRRFPIRLRHGGGMTEHYAMIGMAHVAEGMPLYYDAVNEAGLGMAGLNFAQSARYETVEAGARNVAQFELIPYVLGQCGSVAEARALLERIRVVGTAFGAQLPAARLHWLIADRSGAIVLECTAEGQRVYENPVGVLTNEPKFPVQLLRWQEYGALSPKQPEGRQESRGMGTIGLPGDLSSGGRFVRAAFVRAHAKPGKTEAEAVGQMFHILGSVEQVKGCCEVEGGEMEYTRVMVCWNAEKGIYYHTTYENRRIRAVGLRRENMDGERLACYALGGKEDILWEN